MVNSEARVGLHHSLDLLRAEALSFGDLLNFPEGEEIDAALGAIRDNLELFPDSVDHTVGPVYEKIASQYMTTIPRMKRESDSGFETRIQKQSQLFLHIINGVTRQNAHRGLQLVEAVRAEVNRGNIPTS